MKLGISTEDLRMYPSNFIKDLRHSLFSVEGAGQLMVFLCWYIDDVNWKQADKGVERNWNDNARPMYASFCCLRTIPSLVFS